MTEAESAKFDKLCTFAEQYGVPEHLVPGLCRYYLFGINPGDFLFSVLTCDLRGAMDHGDDKSLAGLKKLWQFIYNRLPRQCWGDRDRVLAWPENARKEGVMTLESFVDYGN